MIDATWAPVACTNAIACPVCPARRRERCATDRPLHLERWDAWKAAGFQPASEAQP
jgi:hypothetical protein